MLWQGFSDGKAPKKCVFGGVAVFSCFGTNLE
jgi:hypothetical protein